MRPSAFIAVLLSALAAGSCATASNPDPRMVAALEAPYRLDAGDEVRVVVFGQPELSNSFTVDAGGHVSIPLIGAVAARGRTPKELESAIAGELRQGYLREPSVSVQVETHRPFFVLGEARSPGQFPYVHGITVKSAVAIAGGFSPRAVTRHVIVTRTVDGEIIEARVPVHHPVAPGDTIHVLERWF